MNDEFQVIVEFAKEWGIDLDIAYDANWGGHDLHCVALVAQDPDSDYKDRVLFWMIGQDQNLCFFAPKESTAEELSGRYHLDLTEQDWPDVPDNARALCMNIQGIDVNNVVHRVFLQYLLNVRADQLGLHLSKVVKATVGGCVGR